MFKTFMLLLNFFNVYEGNIWQPWVLNFKLKPLEIHANLLGTLKPLVTHTQTHLERKRECSN